MSAGSSAARGSHVYAGVDISSGELVAVSDWHLPASTEHHTEAECRTAHIDDRLSQVLLVLKYTTV